jgi:hypothetical protein
VDVLTEGILEVSSGQEKWWRAASAIPFKIGLAGCGKTVVARENFDGPHVWHNKRTPAGELSETDRMGEG